MSQNFAIPGALIFFFEVSSLVANKGLGLLYNFGSALAAQA